MQVIKGVTGSYYSFYFNAYSYHNNISDRDCLWKLSFVKKGELVTNTRMSVITFIIKEFILKNIHKRHFQL